MLTAAVRDLHFHYPNQFVTDVRTSCHEIWEYNPYLSPLSEDDPDVFQIDCRYPLINRANKAPYHCLHGFIEFLNEQLGLAIKPTLFKGDIHLSTQEKLWYSQIHEITGAGTPFWIIAAGGKYDITIKWWQFERYQAVVNYFKDKIQFVQIGEYGHHHPKLEGVIDLRGKTSLRELIRLVYHSQGTLCSITALMHLTAAVETRPGRPKHRPCVVVAGGREPAHWEAYPHHQFIHTNGVLECCAEGGCWKDRTARLRDGDERDKASNLCKTVRDHLPRCMDLITPAEVIQKVELYFKGGNFKFLSPWQKNAARKGVIATVQNNYDRQPLNEHNTGLECERFIQNIPRCPEFKKHRGIVICGGGVQYFTNAWVCVSMLRHLDCRLPIQLWHLGRKELGSKMKALMASLNVECVDALKMRRKFPARTLHGWELKAYSMLYSPFKEVLLLDADNVPVINPEFLFSTPEYMKTGAIFWPDYGQGDRKKHWPAWRSMGLRQPNEPEFESGQVLIDKKRCWSSMNLCMWINENSDFFYKYIHGDKETFHLAFRKMKKLYSLIPTAIHTLDGTMCQHDFAGRRIFQHRNGAKWDLLRPNKQIKDFWFESECRRHLARLKEVCGGHIC
jgi:ADP-heptose:LPS heptosyltransferase